jgi:hypothetical protein
MPNQKFYIKLNVKLVPQALALHEISKLGDKRRGPNQSFESFLSDLVTVAIVERSQSFPIVFPQKVC